MKKMLCSLIVAAFALTVVTPASAAITPRLAGDKPLIEVATEKKKAPAKKTASKKSTKKQVASRGTGKKQAGDKKPASKKPAVKQAYAS